MMDRLEGNELIAEFMGYQWPSSELYSHSEINNLKQYEIRRMNYHASWDWLMPVVEKIESIEGVQAYIRNLGCEICSYGFVKSKQSAKSKIEAVWLAVVKFIQWHNQLTTK